MVDALGAGAACTLSACVSRTVAQLDNTPLLRKLRPIAIGSALGRVVFMCAAAEHRDSFSDYLQPPTSADSSRHPLQPDGSPWPIQVGLTSTGLLFLTHTVTALLQSHPGWVDATLDIRNAFNALHRREFFAVVAARFPTLLPRVSTMYASPSDLFFRVDGSPPAGPSGATAGHDAAERRTVGGGQPRSSTPPFQNSATVTQGPSR